MKVSPAGLGGEENAIRTGNLDGLRLFMFRYSVSRQEAVFTRPSLYGVRVWGVRRPAQDPRQHTMYQVGSVREEPVLSHQCTMMFPLVPWMKFALSLGVL